MNPAYAEINRLLGQSESDKQLVILSNVIREHLPAIDQNEDFSNISKLWERRNNTWSTQLQKYLKERNPPIYSQQDIAAMNNSFNVMVAQCNKEREDSVKNYIKLLDEARHRSKQSTNDLTRFENDSRADIDAEQKKSMPISIPTRMQSYIMKVSKGNIVHLPGSMILFSIFRPSNKVAKTVRTSSDKE